MHFSAVSCPASYGLSGMDRRQSTSRNGGENRATDVANVYSTAIHPQRSPPIFQTLTLPIIPSQEDTGSNIGLSLDPLACSPSHTPFPDYVSPYYQDTREVLSQGWPPRLTEDFTSAQMFIDGRDDETSLDEIVEDNESGIHEAPASEAASYVVRSNTTSPKKRREAPLTEQEKKERNRKYSKTYRERQNQKTRERNNELERAKHHIGGLLNRLTSHEIDIERLVRRVGELEVENRNLRQQLSPPNGLLNPCYLEKETGHGNLEAMDSYFSDNLDTDFEHSSAYPAVPDDFQSPFQP